MRSSRNMPILAKNTIPRLKERGGLICQSAIAAALLLAPLAVSAVNPTLQPISTRFAQTQSDISIELIASTFTDLEIEEEDHFDGWTTSVEIVVSLETISEASN